MIEKIVPTLQKAFTFNKSSTLLYSARAPMSLTLSPLRFSLTCLTWNAASV